MSKLLKIKPVHHLLLGFITIGLIFTACDAQKPDSTPNAEHKNHAVTVPMGGNTWKSGQPEVGGEVTTNGIAHWSNSKAKFTTYVRVDTVGSIKAWFNLEVPEGTSQLAVTSLEKTKKVVIKGDTQKSHYIGQWNIEKPGYIAFTIKGLSKEGAVFANITSIKLKGTAIDTNTKFVKTNKGNYFYWGRRGPSVHLNYKIPDNVKAEWYYNEVTVPQGNDVIGSYFMAIGFGEGYFGIQVNSKTERRVLFSVWSPYETDNPEEVPKNKRIQLIKKGEGVHAGKFGNEGSGGQSYLRFNWKAGQTYKFLLHGVPDGQGSTTYTAYFFAPKQDKWHLIASFKRPKTDTWLTHFYSFLENFIPSQGDITRKVYFDNQWIRTNNGKWIELRKAKFTGDNTAQKGFRMDYAGGIQDGQFYLKNDGFFDNYTPLNRWFKRSKNGEKPVIAWDQLPQY